MIMPLSLSGRTLSFPFPFPFALLKMGVDSGNFVESLLISIGGVVVRVLVFVQYKHRVGWWEMNYHLLS